MKPQHKIKVGISIGDFNGIGIEIILKTFEDSRMLEFCTPIIFGSGKILSLQKKQLNLTTNFNGIEAISQALEGKMNVLNLWKDTPNIEYGKETKEGGEIALKSLRASVQALKNDEIDVLVTAPINKHNIQSKEFNFPGHTDYLAKELEGESVMLMISEALKMGLLTDHLPIKDVATKITPKLIEKKVQIIYDSLVKDFKIIKPKIAVLGLNPHSGDHGIIGNEDEKVIKPTIKKIFNEGKMVFGPYAADSFFGAQQHKKFDAVVAAYHDQGLIPFKTLSFGNGVNYTAGLSKIRTSPDHGTAYEIAGKGQADSTSFKEAVFLAIKIFRNREDYKEINAIPLKKLSDRDSNKKQS
jgi:4-hydroxythreonine-4-phosphate dehydrogenase